jgi:hypothetical protein
MAGTDTSGDRYEQGRATVPDSNTTMPRTPGMPGRGDAYSTAELPGVAASVQDREFGPDERELTDRVGSPVEDRDRPRDRDVVGAGAKGMRALFWLVATAGLVVALVLAAQGFNLLPHFKNPFQSKTTDRSQPVLLKSIQDLSRFVAAEGNFEVVVDLQNNKKYVPDILLNERTLFVAAGSVESYVDFTNIGQGAITDSADHKTVEIRLPAPALGKPNIDHNRSYVFAQQRGLVNRLNDLVSSDPNHQQQLYQLAEEKIANAAKDSGLGERAQENTRKMLDGMLRALGYTSINIVFAAP